MPARLPDLVVIGAPKAATTTLTHWLRTHPQVAVSAEKELEFFDRHYDRGVDWYLEQLPQDPGERVVVEATPTYLSEPGVAERVAVHLPDARFVALLREPAARAWSNYWFFRQLGVESRSWRAALAGSADEPGAHDRVGYVWRGRYADQLAHWQSVVGRDRLHVVLFDDVLADPQAVYDGICEVAGIGHAPVPGKESVNTTHVPRSARLQGLLRSPDAGRVRRRLYAWNARGGAVPAMTPAQRADLQARFAEPNARLAAWLGRPLPQAWGGPGDGVSPLVPAAAVGGSRPA